jgi:beta-ureidopropionase
MEKTGDSSAASRKPVAPYMAVGLSRVAYCIANRRHIRKNLEENIHAAISMVNISMPVKLLNLAEGALTGFTDEIFDLSHTLAAKELFIDIPGEETEFLGRLAHRYETYIVTQCKARWPEVIKDRFFNTMFIIGPDGQVVHKASKNHIRCRERSCTPHDVHDRWIDVFGDGLKAFYPVLKMGETRPTSGKRCSE